LRGINVGGNNIIKMKELKAAFFNEGFSDVVTYINSGNVIFNSEHDEDMVKDRCEKLISRNFNLDIPVCIISSIELADSVSHAPEWWNNSTDAHHDALFVIPPMTAEQVVANIGSIKEEYESLSYHGRVVFWTASIKTYSRTRVSKITKDKTMYRAITVRNANTALKLMGMVGVEN